ncbi:MAG: helix-turn-helix domain-containing protein [Bacillota bacterium]|nr:helix-turn-helix domain-containing protein [Bacillota bacterium]
MIDVKEMSKRLDVSRKTVYKYLKKYNKEINHHISKGKNNQKILSEKGFKLLLELIDKKEQIPKESTDNDHDNKYIELLERQLKDKENQIADLKVDKNHLIKLLDQQQQLHLQLQNNIKLLEVNADKHNQKKQVDEIPTAPQENESKGLFDRLKVLFK